MRKTHTPEQIIDILRQVERATNQGKTATEACRALGISEGAFTGGVKSTAGRTGPGGAALSKTWRKATLSS